MAVPLLTQNPTIRPQLSMSRSLYTLARKRAVQLGFAEKRGFSPYIQQLIRDDLKAAKEGK